MRVTFILGDAMWLRTFVTNALGFDNICYIEQVLDGGHIELSAILTESMKLVESCNKAE